MSERNGPGEIKTESRSPIMTSGVATPRHASNSIVTVMAAAATEPASKPAESALTLVIMAAIMPCRGACAKRLINSGHCSPTRSTLRLCERDSHQRRHDAHARHERPANRAGNFRRTAGAPSMVYRNFEDAQPGARRFHLHLQIPAVSLLAHTKPSSESRRIARNGHISV